MFPKFDGDYFLYFENSDCYFLYFNCLIIMYYLKKEYINSTKYTHILFLLLTTSHINYFSLNSKDSFGLFLIFPSLSQLYSILVTTQNEARAGASIGIGLRSHCCEMRLHYIAKETASHYQREIYRSRLTIHRKACKRDIEILFDVYNFNSNQLSMSFYSDYFANLCK